MMYSRAPRIPGPYGYTLVTISVNKTSESNTNFLGTIPETSRAKTTIDGNKMGAAKRKHLSNKTVGPNVAMLKLGKAPHNNIADSLGSNYRQKPSYCWMSKARFRTIAANKP